MNIYPLPIGLQTISRSSHVERLFTGQKMGSVGIIDTIVTWTKECILVIVSLVLYDSPYRSNPWLQ